MCCAFEPWHTSVLCCGATVPGVAARSSLASRICFCGGDPLISIWQGTRIVALTDNVVSPILLVSCSACATRAVDVCRGGVLQL